MVANNYLTPGFVYYDGVKYTTTQDLKGDKGDKGDPGIQGNPGTITAGNYVLSAPLTLDGYTTITYLNVPKGFILDGYGMLDGYCTVGNQIYFKSGSLLASHPSSTINLPSGNITLGRLGATNNILGTTNFSSGPTIFNQSVDIGGTLNVVSATILNSTLLVKSGSIFSNNATFDDGYTTFHDGYVVLNNTTTVNGNVNIDAGIFAFKTGSTLNIEEDTNFTLSERMNLSSRGRVPLRWVGISGALSDYLVFPAFSNFLSIGNGSSGSVKIQDDNCIDDDWIWIYNNDATEDITVNNPAGSPIGIIAAKCSFLIVLDSGTWTVILQTA